jgi:hypothetical protein
MAKRFICFASSPENSRKERAAFGHLCAKVAALHKLAFTGIGLKRKYVYNSCVWKPHTCTENAPVRIACWPSGLWQKKEPFGRPLNGHRRNPTRCYCAARFSRRNANKPQCFATSRTKLDDSRCGKRGY